MNHKILKLKEAQDFVLSFHRHSPPLKRHKFSTGAYYRAELVGVATVDQCSSAWSCRLDHVELRRLCLKPDAPKNTASFLIAKVKEACFAMGYNVIVTYTRPFESGASLKATGFYLERATWVKGQPTHSKGLLRWVAVRDRQPDAKERAFTKETLAKIKTSLN
tara:strand:+ start:270 stop:758 length:489 start_codon:yes stop_codon:yes gene_type:complete